MYLSRVAALNGSCGEGMPAYNVNRLCCSGLQAIVNGSQSILLGDADITIGAGAEKHEPRALRQPGHALSRSHGRHRKGGHDGRCAARPLSQHAHGCDGREYCQQVGHHTRATKVSRGKPQPRRARHAGRLLIIFAGQFAELGMKCSMRTIRSSRPSPMVRKEERQKLVARYLKELQNYGIFVMQVE